ncbi:MAG: hypothetical protein ACPGVG_12070 [Mycobacterium sp.]
MSESRCTPEVIETYCRVFRETLNRAQAAREVGVDYRDIWRWRKLARQGHSEFAAFGLALEITDELVISDLISRIASATTRQWRALAWLLERLYPAQFGIDAVNRGYVEDQLEKLFDRLLRGMDPGDRERIVFRLAALQGVDVGPHGRASTTNGPSAH